ncbi:glycosyl hydrolase 2 galactose-binding domain-containing protein [Occallatibacter savannae]|uniref:glycosyl hydrolase 2 galactose-binding domain-containing protein n=1 Tax=Occallatibacter savannae TaxID=1002691 RepID=UPI000D699929|nr:discoidin domain-containing protein [Occallatibacter savannae]
MNCFFVAYFLFAASAFAQNYTRGVGVYPGDPKEFTGPSLVVDSTNYRNLALHRPAYQSSAYDYNLTAQLVTDGIRETAPPQWIETSTSNAGVLPKRERELFLDGNVTSSVDVSGDNAWVEFDLRGGGKTPELDRIDLYLRKIYGHSLKGTWTYVVLGSNDGSSWKEVGRRTGSEWPDMAAPGPSFVESIPFSRPETFRSYRVQLSSDTVHKWGVAELALFDQGRSVRVAGPDIFSSAWMSAGGGEEWVYVDLGASCTFDRITLTWLERAAEGAVQISDDAKSWNTVKALTESSNMTDDVRLDSPTRGSYVRVLMTKPAKSGDRYVLSELEVFGRGGPAPVAHAAAAAKQDGALPLAGGAWRVQRASLVAGSGEDLSKPGYSDKDWMIATVPGTVLTSYLNDSAIPDPDFGDNQYAISDSFFCADFWYRDEFEAPVAQHAGEHTWLNFDGINWKSEVYLNGQNVGRIDGGFMRGRFDVTASIHPGATNALAVRIIRVANPGSTKDKAGPTVNGGALGRDNPTFHASAGWDWMSTIRGRDTGIWSNVWLSRTGAVRIENPMVTTKLPLPDTAHADVTIETTLRNLSGAAVSGTLHASFGDVNVSMPVSVEGNTTKAVELSPASLPQLRLANPKLWWPVGYGDPNLYPVSISFEADGVVPDQTTFKAGVRQFTYSEDGGVLKIWINGRRFIPRGGNWGFAESMLRYRAREYDTALRYHRDEHFNMIRNWVGQTGDEAFYDAADRFGVVVWQDFWLANPWDGPDPDDNELFLTSAKDYLLRIRNHASLGIFCGRNEGFPPQPIDDGLRSLVAALEPGSHYISSSADGPVSGHGPYRVEPLRYYFEQAPVKLHSEMGSPNVVEMDDLLRTMPEQAMWPQGYEWPLHDYHESNPFTVAVDHQYGGAASIEQWDSVAQFVNYDSYRGMFEGQSKNRLGLLIWMSHPAWPSLLWQTYDYFFDTDAGYYGAKKGAEPLHIQWNASTDAVEVVNYNAGDQRGLTAHAQIINIDGSVKWEKTATLDSREDSTDSPLKLEFPAGLARTHFIRLNLTRNGVAISSNFYLRGLTENNYKGIRDLGAAKVKLKSRIKRNGSEWAITAELKNASKTPALMVRVKAIGSKSRDLILPALFSDNYIELMPGEKQMISITLLDADTRGEKPAVRLEGYNLAQH